MSWRGHRKRIHYPFFPLLVLSHSVARRPSGQLGCSSDVRCIIGSSIAGVVARVGPGG